MENTKKAQQIVKLLNDLNYVEYVNDRQLYLNINWGLLDDFQSMLQSAIEMQIQSKTEKL